jgi:hypothetical protein
MPPTTDQTLGNISDVGDQQAPLGWTIRNLARDAPYFST